MLSKQLILAGRIRIAINANPPLGTIKAFDIFAVLIYLTGRQCSNKWIQAILLFAFGKIRTVERFQEAAIWSGTNET